MKQCASSQGLGDALASRTLSRRHLLWMMAMAGGGVVTGCAVNPVTGQRQLMLMSAAQEVDIDRQHSPHQFSADYGISQDKGLNQYIDNLGKAMSAHTHRPEMPYNFQAVNANYINAYAFPGGSIALTRGILLEMESEAELAALLGHEIGHVNARHTAQRMTQQTLTNIALTGAGVIIGQQLGDDKAALALGLGGLATGALLAKYSRDDERQADSLALEYMVGGGHNPEGMVQLMDMLRRQSSYQPNMLEMMFSTHPMSDERYNTAQTLVRRGYSQQRAIPQRQERYMDNTARLRRLRPTIERQQQAETALRNEEYNKAETLLDQALRQAPDDYTGLVLMAKTLMIQERKSAARPYLERAIAVYPEEAQAQHLSGVAALHDGQAGLALQRFQTYERLLPGNPNTRFFIGMSYEGLGQRQQAAQAYRQFLQAGAQGPQAEFASRQLQQWQL